MAPSLLPARRSHDEEREGFIWQLSHLIDINAFPPKKGHKAADGTAVPNHNLLILSCSQIEKETCSASAHLLADLPWAHTHWWMTAVPCFLLLASHFALKALIAAVVRKRHTCFVQYEERYEVWHGFIQTGDCQTWSTPGFHPSRSC